VTTDYKIMHKIWYQKFHQYSLKTMQPDTFLLTKRAMETATCGNLPSTNIGSSYTFKFAKLCLF